jgi:hypothetical protein
MFPLLARFWQWFMAAFEASTSQQLPEVPRGTELEPDSSWEAWNHHYEITRSDDR